MCVMTFIGLEVKLGIKLQCYFDGCILFSVVNLRYQFVHFWYELMLSRYITCV